MRGGGGVHAVVAAQPEREQGRRPGRGRAVAHGDGNGGEGVAGGGGSGRKQECYYPRSDQTSTRERWSSLSPAPIAASHRHLCIKLTKNPIYVFYNDVLDVVITLLKNRKKKHCAPPPRRRASKSVAGSVTTSASSSIWPPPLPRRAFSLHDSAFLCFIMKMNPGLHCTDLYPDGTWTIKAGPPTPTLQKCK